MAMKCVWEGMKGNRSACSYIARVRVRVRAGEAEVCREGCGSGHGVGLTPGEAHESAIKEAETDAMKRALSTFGNPFGLALYDKEQQNVRGRRRKQPQSASNGKDRPITWLVLSSEGEYIGAHEDPVDYCKAMRQLLEAISTRDRLRDFWQRNLVTIAMLRRNLPDLKSQNGEHYADILTSLFKQQMRAVWEEVRENQKKAAKVAEQRLQDRKPEAPSLTTNGAEPRETKNEDAEKSNVGFEKREGARFNGRIDKSNLPISAPRRVRDKEHLRYVASQPCIICGRSPGHAHHLRFAQPRALGRKVGDNWTAPLCATHHRALHSVGDEERWWKEKGIDPIVHAVRLWWDTKHGGVEHKNKTAAAECSVVIDGRDGPPEAARQIGPPAQTASRIR
jgi:hypothetical protein